MRRFALAVLVLLSWSGSAPAADAQVADKQKQRNGIAIFTLCFVSNSEAQSSVIEQTAREILLNQNQGKDAPVDGFISGPFRKEMEAQSQALLTTFRQEAVLIADSLKQDEADRLVTACLIPEDRLRQLPKDLYTKFLSAGAPAAIKFEVDLLKKLQPQLKAAGLAAMFD